ncbi:sulfotransferase family protein [Mycolicibacterium sp. ELW1]|uniref:sulfotransferase family protein n=1 Tax=Mycobacteriaceae TaxID=1762 RepID=UPI0011EF91E7|nr:sulfotransferase [Mycobacterium sp. ELW1]QEN13242.1 sulfotransferase family protein [Mycobacterium sp. ELW1]
MTRRRQPTVQSVSISAGRPVLVFVVGFGRSGTSALTRVLSHCGAALPPGLLGAIADNTRGCFEPREAIYLNEAILRRQGRSGYDLKLRTSEDGAVGAETDAASVEKIRAYLAKMPAAPVVVIKEPKITAISDVWFEAARLAGFDVASIIAVRHPAECIGSVEKRAHRQNYVRASPELVSAWWLKYTLLAERDTRGVSRVFVEFPNLLDDWRREVKRIATALGIDLDDQDESAIDSFLTPDLRHHRRAGAVVEPFGTDWVGSTYDAMSAAARDEPWDAAGLDRVFEEYRVSERGFRTAFEDFRRYRHVNWFLWPPLVKVTLEVLAKINRRKETWT